MKSNMQMKTKWKQKSSSVKVSDTAIQEVSCAYYIYIHWGLAQFVGKAIQIVDSHLLHGLSGIWYWQTSKNSKACYFIDSWNSNRCNSYSLFSLIDKIGSGYNSTDKNHSSLIEMKLIKKTKEKNP